MHIDLSMTLQVLTILSMVCVAFKYFIISPLYGAIEKLKEATLELKDLTAQLKDAQHALDKRVSVLEESTKYAHKRITELKEMIPLQGDN